MLYSIRGKITFTSNRFIVVETNGIGYEILVSQPENYIIGEEIFMFLHHEIKEDDEYLIGFRTKEEKKGFNVLLNVNGIGPKTALSILSKVSCDDLLSAISNSDLNFIKRIPGVNEHTAYQILLDLKTYIAKCNKDNSKQYNEIKEALKNLKFKAKDIDKILPQIYIPNATNQEIIKEALRRLHYEENFGQK